MKLLLIRLGKALNAIRMDGILRGGKRSVSAFFKMFQRVEAGDILFITGGVAGDSTRYRIWCVKEELETHGFHCSTTIQDNPFLQSFTDKFKIFVFHRVLFTPAIAKFIEKIKSQKKEIIFETDDLLFDPEYFEKSDYMKNINALEKKLYENGLGSEIVKDPYVKVCTTTTSYLADLLKSYDKKVFIVPNKLSNEDLEIIESIKSKSPSNPSSKIKIGYFSGTISHNRDFARAAHL